MQLLRRGDDGPAVAEIHTTLSKLGLLAPTPQGAGAIFDGATEHAVRAFQQQRGLLVDGIVGPNTYRALAGARWQLGDRNLAYLISQPMGGDDVFALQERLLELGFNAGRADGLFGQQTEQALRHFQREYGLVVDGLCGPDTLRALRQLAPKVRGGRPVFLREEENLRNSGPALRGKRIVIDPGHGGSDRGIVVAGVSEADLALDLARRLEGRMVATGMEALLSRGAENCPSEAERAAFANNANADLFLSLHLDGNASAEASGVATFHFGTSNAGASSTVGEVLAGFIQRELTARSSMLDCRTHPKTWDSLRLTRCTAVRVEAGYLTNAQDRERLLDPSFRDLIAEGILIAVKRLYLLGENDHPTGTFTFAELLQYELSRAESA